MGCSISAANICKIPWWKTIFPFFKVSAKDEADREACEEREMMACLAASKENCTKYARETCAPVFAELRIAERDQVIDPRFNGKRLPRLRKPQSLQLNPPSTKPGERSPASRLGAFEQVQGNSDMPAGNTKRCTNFRGKRLMEDGSSERSWEGPIWSDAKENTEFPVPKETVMEGWEGGLVRPKFDSRNLEQPEAVEPEVSARSSFLWKDLGITIRSRLRNLKAP
eukprot:TRINITY_DN6061_c0_g1_i1.p1 TRINITY_DN6061_c0_g1~~TRINITY_DN6061_c0_g1_i1.p1  ORF type:complete len:225 (+),score=44.06 TRINITY_DN6061_c0_g1_i1:383-1057(+)